MSLKGFDINKLVLLLLTDYFSLLMCVFLINLCHAIPDLDRYFKFIFILKIIKLNFNILTNFFNKNAKNIPLCW